MLSKIKNAIVGLFGLMMLIGLGVKAFDYLVPKVKGALEPTPIFAGLSLDLKLEDARKWPGVRCKSGQEVFKGKPYRVEDCWDSSYSGQLFGHFFKGRGASFLNDELAAIRVLSRDGTVNSTTFAGITKQLDAGFKRVTLKAPEEGMLFWDYGKGTMLVTAPPVKVLMNPQDLSQVTLSQGMVVWTPKMVAISTE